MSVDIKIKKTTHSRIDEVEFGNLIFGEVFSDHMLSAEYKDGAWGQPCISPYGKIEVYPSLCTLHYGQAVFEGLKAFCGKGGSVSIFRPDRYYERLNRSCERLCIPPVSQGLFLGGIRELVNVDREWVPKKRGCSLYIRPFIFASDNFLGVKTSGSYRFMVITSPVGAYFKEGLEPAGLVTSGEYARAVKGGVGAAKTPGNYAASLMPAEEAKKRGFSQVLWLDGLEKRYVEEAGAMNVFFLIGGTLVTPPAEGTILEGVTRDSVIHLAKGLGLDVEERRISIDEVLQAAGNGALEEAFMTGTAAVVSPVGRIQHKGVQVIVNGGKTGKVSQKLYDEITGIQYGEKPDRFGWCTPV